MNDHQKGREGWKGETVPTAVEENQADTFLQGKWFHGLCLLLILVACRKPSARYVETYVTRNFLFAASFFFLFCKKK